MGVDQTSLDRIRNATFPSSRRGYDKQEVEKFLARLADWLETGAGDESRSDTVKRELERVGERTGAILAQAEESAQQIRGEAEALAREAIDEGNAQADQARQEADTYAKQTRTEADAYAKETRKEADKDAAEVRAEAEGDARDTIADAQAQARRIVEEGTRRREDLESVIADLVRRRDEVLDDTEELSGKLTAKSNAPERLAKLAGRTIDPQVLGNSVQIASGIKAGSQSVTTRLKFGRATASPTPNRNRASASAPMMPSHPASGEAGAMAVQAVKTDHQSSARVRMIRAPQRSPSQPPGI